MPLYINNIPLIIENIPQIVRNIPLNIRNIPLNVQNIPLSIKNIKPDVQNMQLRSQPKTQATQFPHLKPSDDLLKHAHLQLYEAKSGPIR